MTTSASPTPRSTTSKITTRLLSGLLFVLAASGWASSPQPQAAADVETQKVAMVHWRQPIYMTGSLTSVAGIRVSPEVSGKITAIYVASGDQVSINQPLVQLNDDVLKGELKTAKASLELSKLNYNRAVQLHKSHSIADSDYDHARSDYQQNMGQVDTLEAKLAQTTIRSPIDGVVGIITPQVGNFVSPGEGLFNVDNLDHLWVDFDLPQNYIDALHVGDHVLVRAGQFQTTSYQAEVSTLDSAVDSHNRTLMVRAKLDNHDHLLRAGSYVSVIAAIGKPTLAAKIPQISVLPSLGGAFVFVDHAGKAVKTLISIIGQTEDSFIVDQGLTKDDAIVISGLQKIRDGSTLNAHQRKDSERNHPNPGLDLP